MSDDDYEVIKPPSTLKGKVSFGADGVDLDMLEKAEAVIASMQGNYLEWVQDDLKKIQEYYDLALADEAGRPAHLEQVFRVAHDIKGQGGSFDYPLMTALGNHLCRFLEKLGPVAAAGDLDVIKLHIDAMRMVIGSRMRGDGGRAGANIIQGIEMVLAKVGVR